MNAFGHFSLNAFSYLVTLKYLKKRFTMLSYWYHLTRYEADRRRPCAAPGPVFGPSFSGPAKGSGAFSGAARASGRPVRRCGTRPTSSVRRPPGRRRRRTASVCCRRPLRRTANPSGTRGRRRWRPVCGSGRGCTPGSFGRQRSPTALYGGGPPGHAERWFPAVLSDCHAHFLPLMFLQLFLARMLPSFLSAICDRPKSRLTAATAASAYSGHDLHPQSSTTSAV